MTETDVFRSLFLYRFAFLSRLCYISVMERNITLYLNLVKKLIIIVLHVLTICPVINYFSFSDTGVGEVCCVSSKEVVCNSKPLEYSLLSKFYTSCLVRLCLLVRVIYKWCSLHSSHSPDIPLVWFDIGKIT